MARLGGFHEGPVAGRIALPGGLKGSPSQQSADAARQPVLSLQGAGLHCLSARRPVSQLLVLVSAIHGLGEERGR